jgi:hypothetical protein
VALADDSTSTSDDGPRFGSKARWKTAGGDPTAVEPESGATESSEQPVSKGEQTRLIALSPDQGSPKPAHKRRTTTKKQAKPKPKPKRERKGKRQAPADLPVPTQGWPALHYRVNRLRRHPEKVPALGTADQLIFDVLWEGAWLRYLMLRPDLKFTAVVMGDKGGSSKSTTCVGLGSVMAKWAIKPVYVLPATTNLKTVTVAAIAGIPEHLRYTIGQLYAELPDIEYPYQLSARVVNNSAGLHVIAENPRKRGNSGNEATSPKGFNDALNMFKAVATKLRPFSDFLLLDAGNDDAYDISVPTGAMEFADVSLFTATADNVQSMNALPALREEFLGMDDRRHVFKEDCWGEHPWMNRMSSQEKAQKSLTLISKTHSSSRASYSEYALNGGAALTVPYDESFVTGEGEVNLDEMANETILAYTRAAGALFKTVAELRNIELPKRGDVLQIPKGFRAE